MKTALDQLVHLASGDVGEVANLDELDKVFGIEISRILGELLLRRDGFFAFGRALQVMTSSPQGLWGGIAGWNDRTLWKYSYCGLADPGVCFAQDIFGYQFCAAESGIYRFDPETGESLRFAPNMRVWAEQILDDPDVVVGSGLARDWNASFGELDQHCRLLPKVPFVLGGTYHLDNLYAGNIVKGMQFRGDLAVQLSKLPDGAEIELKIVD